jgi:hypothetical protein
MRRKNTFAIMKKKECPSCAMEIDANARECPVCGYEFPSSAKGLKWAAIVLAILILLYFLSLRIII